MDKENLYYIVTDGTNERVLLPDHKPLMGSKIAIEREIDEWCRTKIAISIKKYENIYTDKDDE